MSPSLLFKLGVIKVSFNYSVHRAFSVGFPSFILSWLLLESFLLACFPFGWPQGSLPPALIASETGLIHLFVRVVLFYLLGPEIEVHCQITDLIRCSRNVSARTGISCHQSDDTCSKDNCFQRGQCPATPLLSSLPHTHISHSLSIFLCPVQCYFITHISSPKNVLYFVSLTQSLSPTIYIFSCHSLIPFTLLLSPPPSPVSSHVLKLITYSDTCLRLFFISFLSQVDNKE